MLFVIVDILPKESKYCFVLVYSIVIFLISIDSSSIDSLSLSLFIFKSLILTWLLSSLILFISNRCDSVYSLLLRKFLMVISFSTEYNKTVIDLGLF